MGGRRRSWAKVKGVTGNINELTVRSKALTHDQRLTRVCVLSLHDDRQLLRCSACWVLCKLLQEEPTGQRVSAGVCGS